MTGVGGGFVSFTAASCLEYEYPCDIVIETLGMLPNTDLINGLYVEAITVGNCALQFNITNAIAAGNVAARNI